jgi:hypothetical protein
MFGVLPAITPRWYAPMFHIPMSSPVITMMFGWFSDMLLSWFDA